MCVLWLQNSNEDIFNYFETLWGGQEFKAPLLDSAADKTHIFLCATLSSIFTQNILQSHLASVSIIFSLRMVIWLILIRLKSLQGILFSPLQCTLRYVFST